MHYIGIDLSCSARNRSAVAVLDRQGALRHEPQHFKKASELAVVVLAYEPGEAVIAADAPWSVPDHRAEDYAYRSCEAAVNREPGLSANAWSGAAALYLRWYEIEKEHFRDYKVIETYPRVVWAVLGLPGRPRDYRKNREAVWTKVEGITGVRCDGFSAHQVDALLCAFTALCYDHGEVQWFGRPGEGLIIVPAPGKAGRPTAEEEHIDDRFRRFPCMAGAGAAHSG